MWGTGEEIRVLRSTNRQLQNSHGDVKYGTGNGVARLRHMTHGHEQRCGDSLREWECRVKRGKGRKIGTSIIA